MPARRAEAWIPPGHEPGVRIWTTKGIEQHVGLIGLQIWKSIRDSRMHQLARAIVGGQHASIRLADDLIWNDGVQRWVPSGNEHSRVLRLERGAPCGVGDHDCEIGRVFRFVQHNLAYKEDPPEIDTFYSASAALIHGSGDCDDHVCVICTLLHLLGYTVGCEVISTDGKEYVHIYNLVGLPRHSPSRFIALDTAAPQVNPNPVPGWRLPSCGVLGSGATCATHRWNRIFRFT